MGKNVNIIKKDGTKQPFDQEKIKRIAVAAGLSEEQGKTVSENVDNFVLSQNQPEINSSQIREKVLEELKKVNQFAANLYLWYEKTKDQK